jgi:hypothetical protein
LKENNKKSTRMVRVAKSGWSWTTVVLIIIAAVIFLKISATIKSLQYGLTPPELPIYSEMVETERLNPMGWPQENSDWFHHAAQGTATIPIPYQWLIALEAPKDNPFSIFFGKKGLYKDDYILRHGFIKQNVSKLNPDALPIGIAKTDSIYFAGIDRKATAAGFTCAACHTGQITYGDKRYVVDGAPAMIDLGLFTQSLGAALGQTVLSSKFSILNGRFERFAKRVLGSNYNPLTEGKLKAELTKTIGQLVTTSDVIDVTEGFTRLDALNRIGNQVFSVDMSAPENYVPIDAPVNFPHLWTTSWFDWVQYDASIMQPLIRNTGEALGVKAFLDTTGPNDQRYASSVNVHNLLKIEDWIGGKHPFDTTPPRFNGLAGPKWPAEFPPIDKKLVSKGANLYQDLCQSCHLPPIDSEEFWSDSHWQPIRYVQGGENKETDQPYLVMKVIELSKIGTDPGQAGIIANRTVNTTGLEMDTDICAPVENDAGEWALTFVPMNDSATSNFGFALGAVVERTNNQWFNQNFIPEAQRPVFEGGGRPNCLQASGGYKARPLNGVWATAPFLHNGSIAAIYDLLSTQKERPTFIQLGNQAFDPAKLGIVQTELDDVYLNEEDRKIPSSTPDYSDGLFVLDTREAGNFNTGHIFDDRSADGVPQGRIGRKLNEDEKLALIEYLKIL